uniref:hypothetical protein n=1 Tax=Bacillus altitudinis TaxID=293387 RepID=UPI001C92DD29
MIGNGERLFFWIVCMCCNIGRKRRRWFWKSIKIDWVGWRRNLWGDWWSRKVKVFVEAVLKGLMMMLMWVEGLR